MSLIDDLRAVTAPVTGVPVFVSDMITCFRYMFTLPEVRSSRALRTLLSMMITVAIRCAEALGEAPEAARLEALVSVESKGKLLTHLRTEYGIDSQYAQQHMRYRDDMLDWAHQLRWSCTLYERRLECRRVWEPIRTALSGDTDGCMTIINLAQDELKLPSDLDEEFFVRWSQTPRRTYETTKEIESRFRTKMRNLGFASMFKLDMSKRLPIEYAIKEGIDPESLFAEIDVAVHYKTDEYVEGRPGEERVNEATGKGIRTALKEYCGIVIHELGIDINHLSEAFRKEIWIPVVRHCKEELRLPGDGIERRLGCLTFLPKTGLIPENADYGFMRDELNKLCSEPRWRLDERQRKRCISYEELAKVPQAIRAARQSASHLTNKEIARSLMEELLTAWPLYLPWRFRMLADCGLYAPAFANIGCWELNDAMRCSPDLPEWVRKALARNPHQRFWQFAFRARQMKNKKPFRDLIPLELIDLYLEYMKYRKYLVAKERDGSLIDDGTLFLRAHNRAVNGRRMSSNACRALYRKLVRKWLGVHARPHLTRDAYCEYRLAQGDSPRQIKRALGHRWYVSTDRYCRRYGTAYGSAVIVRNRMQRMKAA